jgi:REP element-mobilizing transposase RayT
MKEVFEQDFVNHIYNRANGHENLFIEAKNYWYFLEKYKLYISPIADTYAFCLMPNHFHAMIRLKKVEVIEFKNLVEKLQTNNSINTYSKVISNQFARLFSSYTQSFNKVYARTGSLFQPNLKRKRVKTEDYFVQLILYIHQNPIKHGFVKALEKWPYSSYQLYFDRFSSQKLDSYLSNKDLILELFGSIDEFKILHHDYQNIKSIFD